MPIDYAARISIKEAARQHVAGFRLDYEEVGGPI